MLHTARICPRARAFINVETEGRRGGKTQSGINMQDLRARAQKLRTDKTNLASLEEFCALLFWMPDADVEYLVLFARVGARDPIALPEAPLLDGDEADDPSEPIVFAVDDKALEGVLGRAGGRRDALDDRGEHQGNAEARLGRDGERLRGREIEEGRELKGGCAGSCVLEVRLGGSGREGGGRRGQRNAPRRAIGPAGEKEGRTLFMTAMSSSLFSTAIPWTLMVCAWTPCVQSTRRRAPSQAASERETS